MRLGRSTLAIVLVVAAAFAGALLYYVEVYRPGRERYFTERQLRALGTLAEQIQGAIRGRTSAVRHAAKSDDQQDKATNGLAREEIDLVPAFLLGCPGRADVADGGKKATRAQRIEVTVSAEQRSVDLPRGTRRLQEPAATHRTWLKADTAVCFCACGNRCAHTDLSSIVSPFLSGAGFSDAEIIVAGADGRILFHRGRPGLGLASLSRTAVVAVRALQTADPKRTPAPEPKQASETAPAGSAPTRQGGLPYIEDFARATVVLDVTENGLDHKLFGHPLEIPGDTAWVVAVLIPSHRFEQEVAALSFGALTYVALLLFLAVLSTPLLKIATMGARDRLRRRDIVVLALSLVVGSGVASVVALDLYVSTAVDTKLDEQLQGYSRHLRTSFSRGVGHLQDLLERFVDHPEEETGASPGVPAWTPRARAMELRRVANQRSLAEGTCPKHQDCPALRRRLRRLFSGSVQTRNGRGWSALEDKTTLSRIAALEKVTAGDGEARGMFDMILWTDTCGKQWEKWSILGGTTPLIDLSLLPLFRDAAAGAVRQWPLRAGELDAPGVVVHSQISVNTGERVVVVSIPVYDQGPIESRAERRLLGTAMVVPINLPFQQPIVPPGFGFAVVEEDGQVIFHSATDRSLYENFLDETDRPELLRAAIATASERFLRATYRGRAHRVHVHPLEGTTWHLLVFRDLELARTFNLDILATWLLLFVVYLGVLGAALLFLAALTPSPDGTWKWPSRDRGILYLECLAVLGLTAAFFACMLYLRSDPATLALAPPAPPTSVMMLLLALAAPIASGSFTLLRLLPATSPGEVIDTVRTRSRLRFCGAIALLVSGSILVGIAWRLAPGAGVAAGAAFVATLAMLRLHRPRDTEAPIAVWHPRLWKAAYVGVGWLLLVNVGVLPSLALYQDALDLGIETLTRHGQLSLLRAIDGRNRRLDQKFEGLWQPDLRRARLCSTVDTPKVSLFWKVGGAASAECSNGLPVPGGRMPHESACDRIGNPPEAAAAECDRGKEFFPRAGEADGTSEDRAASRGWWPHPGRVLSRHFSSSVMAALPSYSAEAAQLREFAVDGAADQRWRWKRTVDSSELCHEGIWPYGHVCLEGAEALLRRRDLTSSPQVFLLIIGAAGGLLGLYLLTWRIANDVFGLKNPRRGEPMSWEFEPARGLLLIDPPRALVERLHTRSRVVDLRNVEDLERDWRKLLWERLDTRAVLVDHLDHRMEDAGWNHAKLALLEGLLARDGRPVLVISAVDPLIYLRRRIESPSDEKASEEYTLEEMDRWARALERLLEIGQREPRPSWSAVERMVTAVIGEQTGGPPTSPAPPPGGEFAAAVARECRWTPRLRGLGMELGALHGDRPLTPDEVVEAVHQTARAHYRSRWSLLNDRERLVLVHLAEQGYVSPRNWRVLNGLIDRGLARRAPGPMPMNDSFGRFVLGAETRQAVEHWERAAGRSDWDRLRGMLQVFLLGGGLLLVWARPEWLSASVGAVSMLGGAVGTLSQVLGFFRNRAALPPAG